MAAKYRVAVIGSSGRGNYGHGIDTVWHEVPQTELIAVADDHKGGLAKALERLKLEKGFSDYRRMLDEVKPDIVGIGPRWIDQHHDMVIEAANRGIHIYMEKPFCPTLAAADEMIAACERTHTKLAIAHQTRYSPMLPVIQEIMDSGKLGTILEFRGRGKEDRRGGGEDLWVLGTHIFDLIRALGGNAEWCYARVYNEGHPVTKSDVYEGNEGIGPLAGDAVHAMYGLESGAKAYFSTVRNMGGSPSRFGLTIYGSKGALELHTGFLPPVKFLGDSSWSPGRSGAKWQNVTTAGIDQPEKMEDGGLHAGNEAAVADLIQAIESDRQPVGNIYEARGATEMIVAVFESHRQGKQVAMPLTNRQNPLTMLES